MSPFAWFILIYSLILLAEIIFAVILAYHIWRFRLKDDPTPVRAFFIFLFSGGVILLGSFLLASVFLIV